MITVNNLSYSYPQKELYHNISFALEEGQHCAFLGISGSGKSTLMDLIMNIDDYMYEGDIDIDPDLRIGYVNQLSETDKAKNLTTFSYIGEESLNLQSKLTAIYTEMESTSDMDALMIRYQETLDAFEALGGDDFETIINKTLSLANLIKLKDTQLSDLSGGEFKLIQIIKEMLNVPDVMIMDEPDVFLDFENLNSLRKLINSHKGTLLVITHNRYLLNHCFNKIIHLENTELQEYDGNYIDYNFSLLETKIELQELAHEDNEEIDRNEDLLLKLRFIASQNSEAARGKTVKARAKIQERLKARQIKAPFITIKQPKINLLTDQVLEDKIALSATDYNLAFDEVLLEDVNFEIGSNDKVVIIGQNGTGKTTLLREIFANKNEAIQLSEEIEPAYLSQLQGETLNESHTVREELENAGFEMLDEMIACMNDYGFEEDFLYQKISSLSGGEKNTLQLAKLSVSNANLLLLDEPTSHLDTYSQMALEKALKHYNGAVLMVSHDFYSINNCMDYVLFIENKTIRKMKMKKFRRMIYAKHFDRDYLEIEQQKQLLERRIALALKKNDFILAQELLEELEDVINLFK